MIHFYALSKYKKSKISWCFTDFKHILWDTSVLQIPKIYEFRRAWQKKTSNHEQHNYLLINYIS